MLTLKRIRTTAGALIALGALSLGGAAIASATQAAHRTHSPTHKTRLVHIANTSEPKVTVSDGESDGPGGPSVQSGDQTAPDSVAGQADTGSTAEPMSSEGDGPGGHQDQSGANVDHQFEGEE
jgi:hypothetical protein